MALENLFLFCEEATTYRNEYRYPVVSRHAEKCRERKEKAPKKHKVYSESHDTLQKLDYWNRLPFNALWEKKEPIDPNFEIKFEKKERVLPPRPEESVTTGVDLDDPEYPELRKTVLDYTYKSISSISANEVWRDWKKPEIRLQDKNDLHPKDSVCSKKPIPDLPAGFKGAAKKWDYLQERSFCDEIKRRAKPKKITQRIKPESPLDDSLLALKDKELRLPYEKMPKTYQGYRTPLAIGVDLEPKQKSIHDPYISVSQALGMKKCCKDG